MNTKFNIGDEIYYMSYPEPTKGIIKGIAFVIGEFTATSFKHTGSQENPKIIYSTGAYSEIEESKAFATKEELQNNLFAKL